MTSTSTAEHKTHPLSLQTLLSGFLGSVFGGVASLYAPDNVIFSALCTTLGGTLLVVVNQKVRRSVGRWLMLAVGIAILVSFAFICIADPIRRNTTVYTTTAVKVKNSPGTSDANTIATLDKGQRLKYVGRTWRKYRFVRERASYFDYWREVDLGSGKIGWIYGAYLTSEP